ncbi:MAG: hypothetical protein AMS26_06460 [Bacteroides sp. SM23_62]|nr:MAG: hypothetical protein AMS26_06460 [Bacteroides sp. SM23_62]
MKTRSIVRVAFLAVLTVLAYACESTWSCLRGNGVPGEETRTIQGFTGVVSEGEFDVFIVPDADFGITLEADENLIQYIRTRVSGNTLIVDQGTRKCLRSDNPIRITVHMPQVEYLNLTGSGMITGDNIEADELTVHLTGSGLIDLRGLNTGLLDALITGSGEMIFWGETVDADLDITGSGMIKAFHLESVNCIANISGSGSMQVKVEKLLTAYISGSGNIYYQGNPSVSANITGTGAVLNSN